MSSLSHLSHQACHCTARIPHRIHCYFYKLVIFYYLKKQTSCIGILPSSCTPTPDKPYTRSTPQLMSTTLNVPYTWQRCTHCAKHLANYTHCALHLTNTAVPNLYEKKKKRRRKNTHFLCSTPDEHCTPCALYLTNTTCCGLHLTNTTLTVPYTRRTLYLYLLQYQTCCDSLTVPVHELQLEQLQTLATRWYNLNDHNPCWLQRLQFTTLPSVVPRTFYYTW